MQFRFLFVLIGFVIVLGSCSKYNKILKSTDYNMKYEKAIEYFNKKDYTRAMALLEEILPLVRITAKGEDAYYKYCYCHYHTKEFYLAGYYFKNFAKLYPGSPKAEECSFMSGICNLKNSPRWSLDQTETTEAIKDFQYFMDRYPTSPKKDTCNKIIDKLYAKLEEKAYENAKMYYTVQNYKSASIALKSMVDKYPNTKFKEDALYLIVKSNYEYACNSIDVKKTERFELTIKSYVNFVASYPESRWRKRAEGIYNASVEKVKKLKTK